MSLQSEPVSAPFLDCADRIGAKLCRDALWDGQRCTWLGWSLELHNRAWLPAYRSLGAELYSGTSGIALFLAELLHYTGDAQQRRVLEGALNQTLSLMEAQQGAARIGFYAGTCGIAYALARIGALLGDERLVERALAEAAALKSIDPDRRLLDVIGGSAGAIPALLALAQRHGQPQLAAIAARHGDHLLATASRCDDGWSWDTMQVPGQVGLTGHSHGTAGIVTALLELHRATGEDRYRHGALQGLRYERGLFSPEHANWPDLRIMDPRTPHRQPIYNMAWCHGAPGIGLSRLRCLDLLEEDGEIRRELDAALATTCASLAPPWTPGRGNYSLCHGVAGNAELPLLAAQRLGRPELRQLAEKVGSEGRHHYSDTGIPWPCGVAGAGETPALMLGTAGIGHFYLRLHDPAAVPTALIAMPDES
jgi:lantibiotic biosynthesis protein